MTTELVEAIASSAARRGGPARGADARSRGKRFRIRAGETDPSDGEHTNIDFFGKLVFRSDEGRIVFRKLTLIRGRQNRLTGQTSGDTITIAGIRGGRVVRQGYESTDLRGIRARLTRAAARAINRALEARVFRARQPLGRLLVDMRLSLALVAPNGDDPARIRPSCRGGLPGGRRLASGDRSGHAR